MAALAAAAAGVYANPYDGVCNACDNGDAFEMVTVGVAAEAVI